MITKRKILGAGIIIIALIFSIGIIDSSKNTGEGISVSSNNQNEDPFLSFDSGKEEKGFMLNLDEKEGVNLTDMVAESYANEIKERNPEGITNSDQELKVPSLQNLNADTEKVTKGIENAFNEERFTLNDIKTYEKDTKENRKKYLQTVIKISDNNFKKFGGSVMDALDELIKNRNDENIKKYISAASEQVNDLLEVKTPKSMQEFHLKNLNLWYKKVDIFYAISQFKNDPLKSLVAMEKIPVIIEESSNLQSDLAEKIKDLNINL